MRVLAYIAYFLAFFAGFLTSKALAWDIDGMNAQIDRTNVIVGDNCSGTIISKKERLVLTANHCISDLMVERTIKKVDPKTGVVTETKVMKKADVFVTVRKYADYKIVATSTHLTRIAGADPLTDVAILQIIDVDYVPEGEAPLAPDDFEYKRGLKVFSVGNPAVEFDASVGEGIISAPMRSVDFGTGELLKMFQHTAPVIGGNSGGAIYNEAGQVIGTVTGGLRGSLVNFAAPIAMTKALLTASGFDKVAKASQKEYLNDISPSP